MTLITRLILLMKIFLQTSKEDNIIEIQSIENIQFFFQYIMDKKVPSKSRSFIIEDFIKILQANRYISCIFQIVKMSQFI